MVVCPPLLARNRDRLSPFSPLCPFRHDAPVSSQPRVGGVQQTVAASFYLYGRMSRKSISS